MSFDFLNQSERDRFTGGLEARFGIAPGLFADYLFFYKGEYLHAIRAEAREMIEGLDVADAGVRLAKRTRSGGFKPTTRGIQIFGGEATRNLLELDGKLLKDLVEGRMVSAPEGWKGFVILKLAGRVIGMGLARDGRLLSQLPRGMTEHLEFVASDQAL